MKNRAIFSLISSTLLVIAGVACILLLLVSTSMIGTPFIAMILLICGFLHALNLFSAQGWKAIAKKVPAVLVPILIGILILVNSGVRARGLTVMLMISFALDGFFKIIASIGNEMKISAIGLVGAGLSFLLAIFIAAKFPNMPLPLLALFLGLDLISMGVVIFAEREQTGRRA
ncbi:hypothetical protein [Paraburkholderia dinghuensis]|uniref:DUF308 domain-containing protein n=1 Tax=Paraburkholderia dinghuensis TaxID=2305225 RepID=A0A3N6PX99_9BURK|nr:hypothetical protein [Paraburkholderia dinghuensis]RQH06970.1 hypothetical protein D1Y85_09805 [Paraburkholderia dinghuensis]